MAEILPPRPPEQSGERPRQMRVDRFDEVPAHHDAAILQLEAEIVKADAEIDRGLVEGNVDPKMVETQSRRERNFLRKLGARRAFFADRTVRDLPRITRELSRAKKPPREMRGVIRQRLFQKIELGQAKALVFISGKSPPLAEQKKFRESLAILKNIIPDNFPDLPAAEQLAIAQKVKDAFHSPKSAEELMTFLVQFRMTGAPLETFVRAFEDEAFFASFVQKAAVTGDVQKVFEESLQQAPPEIQEQYRRYRETCESQAMVGFFQPPPEVAGAQVGLLSREQSIFAVRTIEDDGITLHLGANNLGEIHFGSLVRNVALYSVHGQPKLFIYDENADKGIVGPVDLKEVRATLGNMVIDTYFSERFREYSTRNTEQDPTKVVDASLIKIAHAFLPNMEADQETLDARQQAVLSRLARLLVAPDVRYVSMGDKVKFLQRVVADPSQTDAARKFLAEGDFLASAETISMSNFEAHIKGSATH